MISSIKNAAIFIFILAAGLVPVCAQGLPVGDWELTSYKFGSDINLPIDSAEITMSVKDGGRLGGRSGCNVYGGNYAVDNGKLKISKVISTMMACAEPAMGFEREFHAALNGAGKFVETDGLLTIKDTKTSNYLEFKRVVHCNKCPPIEYKIY